MFSAQPQFLAPHSEFVNRWGTRGSEVSLLFFTNLRILNGALMIFGGALWDGALTMGEAQSQCPTPVAALVVSMKHS